MDENKGRCEDWILELVINVFVDLTSDTIILMLNSNQVVKSSEYQFEIFISKVLLKTKFPCQFYTSLRYSPDLPELVSPEVVSIHGEVLFNHTHRFNLSINAKDELSDQKKVTLTVGLRSKHRPLEKIIAGFVTIDLSNYTKYSHPPKIFKIQRCPDQESMIEIGIKSNKVRESIQMENQLKSSSKLRCYKSQVFTEFKVKGNPITKRSCIINKSANRDELHEATNISREFSKLLNVKSGQSGSLTRLLTPDKDGNCQLSFAKLKDSCVSRSLNYDQVRQSVEIDGFPLQVSNFKADNKDFEEANRELYIRLIATEREKIAQDAYIKELEQELRSARAKIEVDKTVEKTQKSTIECSTYPNILTEKSLFSGGSLNCLEKESPLIDLNLLERNSSLLKTLGDLRNDLQVPIRQIQLILQNQVEYYEEESSWEAMRLLETITQKLSLS